MYSKLLKHIHSYTNCVTIILMAYNLPFTHAHNIHRQKVVIVIFNGVPKRNILLAMLSLSNNSFGN